MSCATAKFLEEECRKCRERGGGSAICTAVCLNAALLLHRGRVRASRNWARELLGFEPVGIEEILGELLGREADVLCLLAKTAAYICRAFAEEACGISPPG
ncbi:MAG: hypothetical protein ACP5MH_12310 [Thermoproteus sp.]